MWIDRITIYDGSAQVGLRAPDGSFYVVAADGSEPVGLYHPTGAYWITPTDIINPPAQAPDGSMYISQELWDAAGGG